VRNYTIKQAGIEEDGKVFVFQVILFDEEDGGTLDKVSLTIEAWDRDDAEFVLDEVVGDIAEDYEGTLVDWSTTLTDVH
jgi:hypothetical protein